MFTQSIARFVRTYTAFAALLATTALAGVGCAAEVDAPEEKVAATSEALNCGSIIPEAIAVPAGNKLDFTLYASGVQMYACRADAAGALSWVFQAPDADLFGPRHRIAGSHYAGPTWEALDGSTVVAARVSGVTVDPASIPWLLLQATAKSPSGRMSKVTYIHRLETVGGLAPAGACTAGATADVPYTATYAFYRAKNGH